MVSPGTRLVKNHESLSITDESQFKKKQQQQQQGTLNWKCLGLYVTRQVNLETDTKTLYYSLLKLKYRPSISLKHKKDLK